MVPDTAAEETVTTAGSQWVVFACGDHTFGMPLERSREILPPRAITRLPGCGPEVCGIVAIRGRVLTVFDFGVITGGASALLMPHHRFLVMVVNGRRVAVVVDEVVTVSREELSIVPVTDGVIVPRGIDRDDFMGVGVLDNRSFLALDPDRVVGRLLT